MDGHGKNYIPPYTYMVLNLAQMILTILYLLAKLYVHVYMYIQSVIRVVLQKQNIFKTLYCIMLFTN